MNTAIHIADSAVTKVSAATGLGYISAAALVIIGVLAILKITNKVLRFVVGIILFAVAACIIKAVVG